MCISNVLIVIIITFTVCNIKLSFHVNIDTTFVNLLYRSDDVAM